MTSYSSFQKLRFLLPVLTGLGMAVSQGALGATYGFADIKATETAGGISAKLSVEVTDLGSGKVLFTIKNADGTHSGIVTGVSFQDQGNDLRNPRIMDSTGVQFETGGGALLPRSLSFDEDMDFTRKSRGGVNNGVNRGEALLLKFTAKYDDVIAALESGDIEIGLHVQNLPRGASQKLVSTVVHPLPEGGSMIALLGLGCLGIWFWRRQEAATRG